jgi:hypothetical protein
VENNQEIEALNLAALPYCMSRSRLLVAVVCLC